MNKYLFLIFRNTWQKYPLRIKIEIFLLTFILGAFLSTRFFGWMTNLINSGQVNTTGLSAFISHLALLVPAYSIPFLLIYLLPLQSYFRFSRVLPLTHFNYFEMALATVVKYLAAFLFFLCTMFIGLVFAAGFFAGFYLLTLNILFLLIWTAYSLDWISLPRNRYFFKTFFSITAVMILYSFCYYFTDYYIFFDLVLLPAGFWAYKKMIKKQPVVISNLETQTDHFISGRFSERQPKLNAGFSTPLRALFSKEMLNLQRNTKLRNRNYLSPGLFAVMVLLANMIAEENLTSIMLLISTGFLWLHYSIQFNERYVQADPLFIIKTLPLKFRHLWFAKFGSELVFTAKIIFIFLLINLLFGANLYQMINQAIVIMLIASVLLAAITIFKILFWEQPRTGGLAFHIFVVFSFIMSLNYYLVGPVITFVLLGVFWYLSYREIIR